MRPSASPSAETSVHVGPSPIRRESTKAKIGAAPIISARSPLLTRRAASPSSTKGIACPKTAIAASVSHSERPRGQRRSIAKAIAHSASAPMVTRTKAKLTGSKPRAAMEMSGNDEPHNSERHARSR